MTCNITRTNTPAPHTDLPPLPPPAHRRPAAVASVAPRRGPGRHRHPGDRGQPHGRSGARGAVGGLAGAHIGPPGNAAATPVCLTSRHTNPPWVASQVRTCGLRVCMWVCMGVYGCFMCVCVCMGLSHLPPASPPVVSHHRRPLPSPLTVSPWRLPLTYPIIVSAYRLPLASPPGVSLSPRHPNPAGPT